MTTAEERFAKLVDELYHEEEQKTEINQLFREFKRREKDYYADQSKKFHFGKYKGEYVASVLEKDRKYCEFIFRQDWLKPDLKQQLKNLLV